MKREINNYICNLEDHIQSHDGDVFNHPERIHAVKCAVALAREIKMRQSIPVPAKPAWLEV